MLTMNQKADIVVRNLVKLADEYREEVKPRTADRVLNVKVELSANPEVAARLYDLLMGEGA